MNIGVDITKISRFENPSPSFLKRILHQDEMKDYQKSENKPRFLAKIWSIKEAMYKADNLNFPFNSLKLCIENRVVTYPGYYISTSSEEDYYIAMVIKGDKNETKN